MKKQNPASEPSTEAKQKSNTELLNEISFILEHSSAEDMDLDTVLNNLDILDERAPIEVGEIPGDSWETIYADYQRRQEEKKEDRETADESKKGLRKPRRVLLRTLYAAVLIVLLLFAVAKASGFDPIQSVVKWTGDLLFISRNPSGELELPEGSESEYRSLREALDQNGAEDALCPSWIPSDYEIESINVKQSARLLKITAFYFSDDNGKITAIITKGFSNEMLEVAEADDDGYYDFEYKGIIFEISHNIDLTQANASIGDYRYSIAGTIAKEEMESIIRSLFRE